MTTPSQLQDLLSKYYFFRGVLFAIAAIALIEYMLGVEHWEALRALHALIASWNVIPIFFASLLPESILGVPILTDPAAIGNLTIVIGLGLLNEIAMKSLAERENVARKGISLLAFVVRTSKVSAVLIFLFSLLIMGLAKLILPGPAIEPMAHFVSKGIFCTAVVALSVYLLSSTALCLIVLRNFRQGVLAVLGFFATVEVLYLARLPGVSDWVNSKACKLLEIPSTVC